MNIQAWPFLISRNRTIDYRTVVAPRFMVDSQTFDLLAEAAGGDLTEPDYAIYREIHGSKGGNMSLIFRVVRAESQHIGLEGSEELKDQNGRSIYLIEGFAVKGQLPEVKVTNGDFLRIQELMKPAYRAFWDTIDGPIAVKSSEYFDLQEDNNVGGYLKLKVAAPYSAEPVQVAVSKRGHPQETEKQWVDKGDRLYRDKRYKEALAAFEQALQLNPNSVSAYVSKGRALHEMRRYEAALAAFEQALQLNPNSVSAYASKGRALHEMRRYEEALVAYSHAIRLDPNNPDMADIYSRRAEIYRKKARADEDKALKLKWPW